MSLYMSAENRVAARIFRLHGILALRFDLLPLSCAVFKGELVDQIANVMRHTHALDAEIKTRASMAIETEDKKYDVNALDSKANCFMPLHDTSVCCKIATGLDLLVCRDILNVALLVAVRFNRLQAVRLLLSMGADVNFVGPGAVTGFSAHFPSMDGFTAKSKNTSFDSVQQFHPLDLPGGMSHALHRWSRSTHAKDGVKCDTDSQLGDGLLQYAAYHLHADMIDLLLEHKCRLPEHCTAGNSALFYAVSRAKLKSSNEEYAIVLQTIRRLARNRVLCVEEQRGMDCVTEPRLYFREHLCLPEAAALGDRDILDILLEVFQPHPSLCSQLAHQVAVGVSRNFKPKPFPASLFAPSVKQEMEEAKRWVLQYPIRLNSNRKLTFMLGSLPRNGAESPHRCAAHVSFFCDWAYEPALLSLVFAFADHRADTKRISGFGHDGKTHVVLQEEAAPEPWFKRMFGPR